MHYFEAKIYKIGINWAVDVPLSISSKMVAVKGYIRIKGKINEFEFTQTLVPVKNAPYRLFVNLIMMKGGKTALGEIAAFKIEENQTKLEQMYPIPKLLEDALTEHHVDEEFKNLSAARIKDILKYLSFVRTEATMKKNIDKVITQLQNKVTDVKIP